MMTERVKLLDYVLIRLPNLSDILRDSAVKQAGRIFRKSRFYVKLHLLESLRNLYFLLQYMLS